MQCPSCSTDLPQGAKYCPTCGSMISRNVSNDRERQRDPLVGASPSHTPSDRQATDYGSLPNGVTQQTPSSTSEPVRASLEETNSAGVAPSVRDTFGTILPTPPLLFWGKSGILLAATGLLIIAIIVASTWLAIYASFHRIPIETPTPTAPTGPMSSYPAYMPGHGTLLFSDPLNGMSTQTWKPATGCSYTQNHYQVTVANQTQPIHVCLGPTLRNFAFVVQMTIVKGDCGGLVFRGDVKNNIFYNYMVCWMGVYSLAKYVGSNPGVSLIRPTRSSAINGDTNQSITLGVYANGDNIIVYANGKQLGSVRDNASAMGRLGLEAVALSSGSTQVIYSDAQGWSL